MRAASIPPFEDLLDHSSRTHKLHVDVWGEWEVEVAFRSVPTDLDTIIDEGDEPSRDNNPKI